MVKNGHKPAFPHIESVHLGNGSTGQVNTYGGLSVREYHAIRALQAILVHKELGYASMMEPELQVEDAYLYADLMIRYSEDPWKSRRSKK